MAFALFGDERNEFAASTDPCLQPHRPESPWAVAEQELACPGRLFVLGLVGEGGDRVQVVDVQREHIDLGVGGQLEDRPRRE